MMEVKWKLIDNVDILENIGILSNCDFMTSNFMQEILALINANNYGYLG